MKTAEAKIILQSYRPTGEDARDPVFREALALAERDAELRAWFAAQQRSDLERTKAMASTAVPAGLRDSILAAADAMTPNEESGSAGDVVGQNVARRAQPTSRIVWLCLGAAAAVAVVLTATLTRPGQRRISAAESPITEFAILDAETPSKHINHGDEAKALNRKLNTPTTRLGGSLLVNFQSLRDNGCRTVQVEGHDVLETCFRRDGVQFHCYIARRTDFPTVSASTSPEITQRDGRGVASWSDEANLYIVISKPGPALLKNLL